MPLGQLVRVFVSPGIRVHVMGDNFRLDAEKLLVEPDGLFEVLQRLQVFHVADVLADKGIFVPGQAEGVLLLGAAGQDRLGSKLRWTG